MPPLKSNNLGTRRGAVTPTNAKLVIKLIPHCIGVTGIIHRAIPDQCDAGIKNGAVVYTLTVLGL